jgi:hypothetical protein
LNESPWLDRLISVVDQYRLALGEDLRELQRLRKDVNQLQDLCDRAEESIESRRAQLEDRYQQVRAWQTDPDVLVRQTAGGYGPKPYHDAADPCSHVRVWKREKFDAMPLGDAEKHGFRPCLICGAQALRRRTGQ